MPQPTLTTSNQSLLNNNLQPLYKLLSSLFLLSIQLQSQIWTPYIETSFQLSLVTQLLQNTSPQIANSLQTQTVFSFLTTESMYHLLVISIHVFSSIIIITSILDILVKTKHWNQFATDIPIPVSVLMYNNSVSSVLLVCNLSHNVISPMDLSNNFLSPNNHGITFLWTSSRNLYHSLGLILFQSQLTNSPSKQYLSLLITPSCLQTQYICSSSMCSLNMVFLPMLPLTEAHSLCQTSSVL